MSGAPTAKAAAQLMDEQLLSQRDQPLRGQVHSCSADWDEWRSHNGPIPAGHAPNQCMNPVHQAFSIS
ncbi:hypothetical protein MDA_GLEAN10014488 [Myotis davidii]|uniref:Uncharacterized protein n=1 Tax=Myotis davidii TaxID=225400 RepID=L5MEA1_MYODS|nr:hypothetical protein MDA_GLEAN10014488 [Myotis davidii]